jgi:hypothetical protein
VRMVCELIENGELGEAQAVIDAAGCTCPSGDVWGRKGGIYDELGEKYIVPSWVIGVPTGVVDTGDDEAIKEGDLDDASVAKGKKGKGRMLVDEDVPVEGDLRVRVRLSHTARDVVIRTRDDENVGIFLHRVRDEAEVYLIALVIRVFWLTAFTNSFLQ